MVKSPFSPLTFIHYLGPSLHTIYLNHFITHELCGLRFVVFPFRLLLLLHLQLLLLVNLILLI